MTTNDDRNFEADDAAAGDPLRDDLRRQAMAERPAFSDELHVRIMQRLRSETPQEAPHPACASESFPIRRWRLPAAIAAMLLVAAAITAAWMMRTRPATPLPMPLAKQDVQSEPTHVDLPIKPAPALAQFTSGFSGLFSQTRQPRLMLKLPIVSEIAARLPEHETPAHSPAPANPGSADWLASSLQKPMNNATAALNEVIPPEMKLLVALAQAHQ